MGIEIVVDGRVVADQASVAGREARLEREIEIEEGGWLAARVSGPAKTYAEGTAFRKAESIGACMDEIGRSMRVIGKSYKFDSDAQRALAVGKFGEGRAAFGRLLAAAE